MRFLFFVFRQFSKGMNNMKSDKKLWSSVSILIGAVILILSLLRGIWQTSFLVITFVVWGAWVAAWLTAPYRKRASHKRRRDQSLAELYAGADAPIDRVRGDGSGVNSPSQILMRHVNLRITAYIHTLYPEATWQWCEKKPEKLVLNGGIGRIRVYGVDDYDHADVNLDKNGGLHCSMIKVVPIPNPGDNDSADNHVPPNQQPVDPQIWYETSGRQVLEEVIADLNSRGHTKLTLTEDGNVIIIQDKKDITVEQLSAFPKKVYWPRLLKVLQGEGLAAETVAKGILVSW